MRNPKKDESIAIIYEKHAWWERVAEVHSLEVEGSFAGHGDDHFVVRYRWTSPWKVSAVKWTRWGYTR